MSYTKAFIDYLMEQADAGRDITGSNSNMMLDEWTILREGSAPEKGEILPTLALLAREAYCFRNTVHDLLRPKQMVDKDYLLALRGLDDGIKVAERILDKAGGSTDDDTTGNA